MTTTEYETDIEEFAEMTEETPPAALGNATSDPGPYAEAVEEYLEAASWLGPADAPLKVHARSIAKSLDRQLELRGEVQSALASSFDKVLLRLDKRRPPAQGPAPTIGDDDGNGTPSMFGYLSD